MQLFPRIAWSAETKGQKHFLPFKSISSLHRRNVPAAWTSSWSWFILKGVGGGLFIGLKSDHPASCDLVSLSATVHTSHSRPGFRNNLKGGSKSHRLLEIIKSGHAGKIQKASAWFWYFLCIRTYVTSTVDRENYFSARPMVNVSQNCQFYANLNLQQHYNSIAWGDKSRGQTWNCCHFCFCFVSFMQTHCSYEWVKPRRTNQFK